MTERRTAMRESRYPCLIHHIKFNGPTGNHLWHIDDQGYVSPVVNIYPFRRFFPGYENDPAITSLMEEWLNSGDMVDITTAESSCPTFTFPYLNKESSKDPEHSSTDQIILTINLFNACQDKTLGVTYFLAQTINTPSGSVSMIPLQITDDFDLINETLTALNCEVDGNHLVNVTISVTTSFTMLVDSNLSPENLNEDILAALTSGAGDALMDAPIQITKVQRQQKDVDVFGIWGKYENYTLRTCI
jgi:hypothetical protein